MSALSTWEERTSDPIIEGCEPPCPWKSSRWCSLLLSCLSGPAIATFWRLLGYQVISFQGWKRERIFSFFLNFNCNFSLTLCMYCVCMWCVLQTHSCNHMHVKVKEQLLGMGSLLSLWLPGIKLSVFSPWAIDQPVPVFCFSYTHCTAEKWIMLIKKGNLHFQLPNE